MMLIGTPSRLQRLERVEEILVGLSKLPTNFRLGGQAPARGQSPLARDRRTDRQIDERGRRRIRRQAIRGRPHAEVRAVQRQFALDGLAQILHEMEPVADLPSRGGGPTRGLGVAAVAVPTDRVDVRMRHQPLLDGLRGVIIEHVDHGVPFQVHQDGAVGAPFALGPREHQESWGVWLDCDTPAGLKAGIPPPKRVLQRAVQHLRAHVEHALGAVATPAHLLALDHATADHLIHRGFRRRRRDRHPVAVPNGVTDGSEYRFWWR